MVEVAYNGMKLSDYFIISELSRPLPEFRDSSIVVEGADGESFDGLTIGVRECSFTLTLANIDKLAIQDAARTLMALFAVTEPKALTFSDEKDAENFQLVRYAVPTGAFDSEEFIRAGKWTCRFKQHDPYLYGKQRTATIPADKSLKVSTGGNAITYPMATAKPSGSRYTVSNGSALVRFDAEFSNNTLTLDFAKQSATLSPSISNAQGIAIGSRFFPLLGTVTLTASAATTLNWTERWL